MQEKYIHYPDKLLKIETRQQVRQLSLYNEAGSLDSKNALKISKSIERVLNLNENGGKYSIEFPPEIEQKVPEKYRATITKELSANEVRVLTAIVKMAQEARFFGKLKHYEDIERAYFVFSLSELYENSGAKKIGGKFNPKQRELIREAILNLHRKEFVIPREYLSKDKKTRVKEISISPLLQLHKVQQMETLSGVKKGTYFKITIDSVFFDFTKENKNTYFNLPANLNMRLREINTGRPNTGVELFIKCLYQASHCAKANTIEYGYQRLSEIMRLERYKENNNHSRIKKTIEKAFNTAIKLSIIHEWKEGVGAYGEKKFILSLTKNLKE